MKINLARVLRLFTAQLASGNQPGSSPIVSGNNPGNLLPIALAIYIIVAHEEISTTNLRAHHDRVAFAWRDCEALGPAEPDDAIPAE
jgi:hypothetical protein